MATHILAEVGPDESPQRTRGAEIRAGLAPGRKEARLQLADGTPLSGWLTSPAEFDSAVAEALKQHQRAAILICFEEAL